MNNLPIYISVIFALTTLLTVLLFYKAADYSMVTLLIVLAWLALQAVVGLSGFYTITNTLPPRLLMLGLPAVLVIMGLFVTTKGQQFLDNLDLKTLTILHTVRIPVEIVLYWLFINKTISGLMTFAGRNFDILAGLTAPFIYYFGLIKKQLSKKVLLVWNFTCLALLLNIVVNAVLSVPTPFQQFAFNQPNIAILYFPFNWLPCCVVPLVLLSHLATIKKLWKL